MKTVYQRNGFTLVEMLVVLALLGLLVTISMPYSQKSGAARKLDAEVQIIAAKLRDAQSLALFSNRDSQLLIDLERRRLTGPQPNSSYQLADTLGLKVVTSDDQVWKTAGAFRFFPDGGSTGGRIVVTSGAFQREIAINWLTGSVILAPEVKP